MNALDRLLACTGTWRGRNRLEDPHGDEPQFSPSTALVTPLLGGTFARLDYTWSYRGSPQAGSLLVGYRPDADLVTGHWIDTWHMGREVMACKGPADPGGGIAVSGSYAAPPGPDWGWRIEIAPAAGRSLAIVMVNISPQGEEEVAVEAEYVPG